MKKANIFRWMLFGGACVLSTARSGALAEDWPQWGGTPVRNMFSPAHGLPSAFTKDKKAAINFKSGTEEIDRSNVQNLKWVANLGSQSYGNVTVSGGRVFIGTNNEHPRDSRHTGDRSILLCFDEK